MLAPVGLGLVFDEALVLGASSQWSVEEGVQGFRRSIAPSLTSRDTDICQERRHFKIPAPGL